MNKALFVLMLASVAFAGCSEDSKPSECEDASCTIGPDKPLQEGTGLIRGVVVDPSITPIADATIAAINTELTTTSDENGAFYLTDLAPGTYFLSVSKLGFTEVQQGVEVVADLDDPALLKIMLQPDPDALPYASYVSFKGYVGCAAQAAMFVERNVCFAADPDQGQVLDFGTDDVPDVLQTELIWDYTQLFGERLGIIEYVQVGGESKRVGNIWGTSPLTCRVTLDSVCDNGDGTGGGGDGLNTTGFEGLVEMRVYANCFQTCVPDTAVGVGIVLQQEYEQFGSAFFNFQPPEAWTFIENGPLDP